MWRNGDLCMSVQFRWCQRGNVHWRRLRKRSRMKHRTIYRKKYMCVGGDRHCLSIFAILEEKQNKTIRSGYHFYDLFIIWDELLVFLCWKKFWAVILDTCWTNSWTYAMPCVDLCQTSAGHMSWFLYFACVMSLIRLVGIPSMSIIRFAGSPLGFEMIGWMWGTTFSINASGCECHCHCVMPRMTHLFVKRNVFLWVYMLPMSFLSHAVALHSQRTGRASAIWVQRTIRCF